MYSSIEHLATTLQLNKFDPHNLVMFSAYFDESGTTSDGSVLTVAGSLSTVGQWMIFEEQWCEILSRYGIKIFHMTDCASSRGEFSAWGGQTDKRRQFIAELAKCAAVNIQHVYSFSLEMESWRRCNEIFSLQEHWGPANVLLSLCSIYSVIQATRHEANPVEFVYESGAENMGILLDMARNKYGISVIPRQKVAAIPCQASDLVAWKDRKALEEACWKSNIGKPEIPMDRVAEDIASILRSKNIIRAIPCTSLGFNREAFELWCERHNVPRREKPE